MPPEMLETGGVLDSMFQGRSLEVLQSVFLLTSQTPNCSIFVFHDLIFNFFTEGFAVQFVSLLVDVCRTCDVCNPEQLPCFYINNFCGCEHNSQSCKKQMCSGFALVVSFAVGSE